MSTKPSSRPDSNLAINPELIENFQADKDTLTITTPKNIQDFITKGTYLQKANRRNAQATLDKLVFTAVNNAQFTASVLFDNNSHQMLAQSFHQHTNGKKTAIDKDTFDLAVNRVGLTPDWS